MSNQGTSTNYNVLLPVHLMLRLSKHIKIGREIIPLEEASQLVYKLWMKLD